jgi:hypothetical protein
MGYAVGFDKRGWVLDGPGRGVACMECGSGHGQLAGA